MGRDASKKRIAAMILLALGLILCGGCMTYTLYDGPHRPQGELGILKLGVISGVDGGDLTYLTGHNLAVLPGHHSLSLTIDRRKGTDSIRTFDVIVKAKHVYEGIIERDPSGKGAPPVIAVVDRTANQVVARHPPLLPEPSTARPVPASPAPRPKADHQPETRSPDPEAKSLRAANSLPRPGKTIEPDVIAQLRMLKKMKNDGLLTHQEYVRLGNALLEPL